MKSIVIDSNVLVGLLDKSDTWHERALEIQQAIKPVANPVIFDIVVVEALTVTARRLEEKKRTRYFSESVAAVRAYAPSSAIVWLSPQLPSFYSEILELMERFEAKLSFHDAFMALYMKRNTLQFIASFDPDFDALPYLQRIRSGEDVRVLLK